MTVSLGKWLYLCDFCGIPYKLGLPCVLCKINDLLSVFLFILVCRQSQSRE